MKSPSKTKIPPKRNILSVVFGISAVLLIGALTAVVSVLYINVSGGFLAEHSKILKITAITVISVLTAVAVIFQLSDNRFVYRLFFSVMGFATTAFTLLYLLKISGFWDKIKSIEDLRSVIEKTGNFAVFATLLMQILQVVILPIPGVIAIGASVALFGAFKGAVISFTGIITGSFIAFLIGRKLGYKTTAWLVGKDALDKARLSVEGKDKAVLTFMFLFPFFPDDVLCFVAGLSSMSFKYFSVMIVFTRLVSVFTTAYSVNGNIIPYNTWWGILLWIVLIVGTFFLSTYVYKHGDSIEKFFENKFIKNKKN